jgi:hypothetical protein
MNWVVALMKKPDRMTQSGFLLEGFKLARQGFPTLAY